MFLQFSPNMLKTFDICPKKFEFRFVKNVLMPVNDDYFEFGKNIHALASYYLRGENIDNMEKSLCLKEFEVWSYLKSLKYFSYNVIKTEYSLSVKVGEYFFGGRLDALVKNEDTYYILDYKTGATPNNPTYDYQTIIYILSIKEFFNTEKIKFVYIDLKNREEKVINYTPELYKQYCEKLESTALKIKHSDNYTKKANCKCEYSIVCY